MRDDYLQRALKVIDDPTILVNVVSRRVKQLKRGNRPVIELLDKLSAEDVALPGRTAEGQRPSCPTCRAQRFQSGLKIVF